MAVRSIGPGVSLLVRVLSYASLALSWAGAPQGALAQSVGVGSALLKVRPDVAVPSVTDVRIEAARNEMEPFQLVVGGGSAGVTGVSVVATELVGPGGAVLSSDHVTLYRVGLYEVVTPSNTEGAPGMWPDPLIPDVDTYFGERRNAFPFDVPAGESRAVWGDVFVPPDTTPGIYTGSLTVTGAGLPETVVPVSLRVRAFTLPSTATLRSAYGMGWDAACRAHRGSYEACPGDAGVEAFHVLYARAGLDHRISIESVVYDGPHDGDWTHFDALYGPLLDGTADTRLAGARLTAIRLTTSSPTEMQDWHDHFAERGWLDALFDYTCDEPPAGCAFTDIATRAANVHAAGIRTLVTTDIDGLRDNGLLDAVDIATPILQAIHDRDSTDRRAEYDAFLAASESKALWWYQSCISHGCGDGCSPTTDPYFTGWPSYVIDTAAIQNRAMEWLAFRYRISGELYFETTYDLPTAWEDQCDFSGNGDGTLLYPGTPARIGGATDIPVESIRFKLIREGMEDYEYLHLLETLGDRENGEREVNALFPRPQDVAAASPEALYLARSRMADRIEELMGTPPTPPPPPPPGDGGALDGGNPAIDSGTPAIDGSTRDAASAMDARAGGGTETDDGCGCSVPGADNRRLPNALAFGLFVVAAAFARKSTLRPRQKKFSTLRVGGELRGKGRDHQLIGRT